MRRSLVWALGLALLIAPGAWAQTASGQVYGVVTDESGAVLPGAASLYPGKTPAPGPPIPVARVTSAS